MPNQSSDKPTKSNRRRQFGVGGLARDRGHRERLATEPLQFNFLGDVGNGIAHLLDNGLQCIRRDVQPSAPGTNLNRISHIDFIANGRTSDALHGGIPLAARVNRWPSASFHFVPATIATNYSWHDKGRPKAALSSLGSNQLPGHSRSMMRRIRGHNRYSRSESALGTSAAQQLARERSIRSTRFRQIQVLVVAAFGLSGLLSRKRRLIWRRV